MSNENKIRDATDAIKGLVEAVPVYQDAVQPAAKEIGTALQTVARSIHIALAPISALVWGYERIKDYLSEALAKRLEQVPPEHIITPNPTVAVPAIESLRYTAHDPTLREMYANLLATAIDARTAKEAHPAFAELIRQLSPDEARILKYIADKQINTKPTEVEMVGEGWRNNHRFLHWHPNYPLWFPILSGEMKVSNLKNEFTLPLVHFSLLEQKAGCKYKDLASSYIDNLCRLGLTEILRYSDEKKYSFQQPTRIDYAELMDSAKSWAEEEYRNNMDQSSAHSKYNVSFSGKEKVLRLTPLGLQFCKSCVLDKGLSI